MPFLHIPGIIHPSYISQIINYIGYYMERPEAMKLWLPTYTTGRPCKNGHYAHRYTQSGTCSKCVNNTITKPEDADLSVLKVRVWQRDIDKVNGAMYLAMVLRRPGITMSKVTHRGKFTKAVGTSAMLHYLVHKDDIESLSKYAAKLFNDSKAPLDMSIVEERHKIAAIPKPLPEWKP